MPIQYNYMNTDYHRTKGLELLVNKDIGVIIMEPLLGGKLANPPEPIESIIKNSINYAPAELSFRWLWHHKGISSVLSGMNSIGQVNENSIYANKIDENINKKLYDELIGSIVREYKKRSVVNCTECNYCQPCPMHINIPQVIKIYNEAQIYNDLKSIKYKLNEILRNNNIKKCLKCKSCEKKCPQKIPIMPIISNINNNY